MSVNFHFVLGDITKVDDVDAIVNCANSTLLGGGGVDGAIHRAAGPDLLLECMTLGGCATGGAKITKAYNLPYKNIIHAVGPVYSKNNPDVPALLYAAYTNSLELAKRNNLRKIAFSAISTGVYGYPLDEAARIAIQAVRDFCEKETDVYEITWVLFLPEVYEAFTNALTPSDES